MVARFEILLEEWLMTISDGLEHRVSLEDRGIRLELVLRWIRSPFEVSVAFFKFMSIPVQVDTKDIRLKIPQLL